MNDPVRDLNMDPELLAGFLDETRDQLAEVQSLLVAIEQPGDRAEILQAIFRAAHSIKGNAAFFGFLKAKTLAHTLENLLDALRTGKLEADAVIITTLLEGFDLLGAMFERIRAGRPEVDDPAALEAVKQRITAQVERVPAVGPQSLWEGIRVQLAAAEAALPALDPHQRRIFQQVVEQLRRLDPGRPVALAAAPNGILAELTAILVKPFEGTLPEPQAKEVLRLLQALRAKAADEPARALADTMLEGYQAFTEAMGFDPLLRDFINERLTQIPSMPGFAESLAGGPSTTAALRAADHPAMPAQTAITSALQAKPSAVVPEPPPRASAVSASPSTEPSAKAHGSEAVAKSMRVSEAKIDTFLRYVGELLVVGDMFDHLYSRSAVIANGGDLESRRLAKDLRRASETFGGLSSKLQAAIMSIRKVPVRPLLQKVPRIARDAALAKGKECQVVIEGDSVEIDKSLVDLLDAPLTHMSRNAADHGIEPPDRREAAGKPRLGTVTVRAVETSSSVVVTVEDDGAGLDLERIRAKAESMGLIRPGMALSDEAIADCIFAPGLSTAEQVTDISGRGVGMDVVKRAIEQAGGAILITTRKGLGTRFQITLPKRVTTQILIGYLFRLHDQLFVVPLDRVRETFRVLDQEITTVGGDGRCIMRRGEITPLVSLAGVLGLADRPRRPRTTAIAIEARQRRIAIEVDQVVGVQKVVIREISGLPAKVDLLAGGALMGDGGVALILDVDVLVGASASAA